MHFKLLPSYTNHKVAATVTCAQIISIMIISNPYSSPLYMTSYPNGYAYLHALYYKAPVTQAFIFTNGTVLI